MDLLYVLLLVEILLLIISFILTKKDIFSPANIMVIMFIVSTIFAVMFKDRWNIDFQLSTFIVIVSGLIEAILIDTLFCRFKTKKEVTNINKIEYIDVNTILLILTLIVGVVAIVLFYLDIKRVVSGYNNITDNLFTNYRNIKNGYVTPINEPLSTSFITNQLYRVMIALGYVSSLCLAWNLNSDHKIHQIGFHIVLILMAMVMCYMEGARGGILQIAAAFAIDYFICFKRRKGWDKSIHKEILIILIIMLVVAVPVFYLSAIKNQTVGSDSFIYYVGKYIGGSIALLNLYMLNPLPVSIFGQETFAGLLNNLSSFGLPIESSQVALEFRNEIGNVYTFFRRPFHDFGLIGMLVCTMLFIAFFSYIYHKKIKNNYSKRCDYWILFYSLFIYWLVISSVENYLFSLSIGLFMNIIVTMIIFFIFKNSNLYLRKITKHE